MLFVDDRTGSKELYAPLCSTGLPVEMVRMDYADFAFLGRGVGGHPLNIGIERKRLSDLVDSLRSGRLSGHQLPGLLGPNGAYDHAWLVVEGQYRIDAQGRILVRGKASARHRKQWVLLPGGMPASEMEKHVLTLELCAGCHVRYTNSPEDTVHFLTHLYRWFTDKDFDQHMTHLAPQRTQGAIALSGFREVVSRFPGVGVRTSLAVETHFGGSLVRAVTASVHQWAEVTTLDRAGKPRRLGTTTASKIVNFLSGV
jgi:ERCC4-type nuclease